MEMRTRVAKMMKHIIYVAENEVCTVAKIQQRCYFVAISFLKYIINTNNEYYHIVNIMIPLLFAHGIQHASIFQSWCNDSIFSVHSVVDFNKANVRFYFSFHRNLP